jgi:hypothetical protein
MMVAVRIATGQLVIVAILTAGVAAAGFAWWYQYHQGRRALAYWGAEGALLVRSAPRVELLVLDRTTLIQDATHEDVFDRAVIERRDISNARGLIHARQALLADASFLAEDTDATPPHWQYALRFRDEARELDVAFDLETGRLRSSASDEVLRLGPTLKKGLKQFFIEQLASPAAVNPTSD